MPFDLRFHVISAVFRRNVASYFSGVLGYLVIVVFVVAGAFVAFNPEFFSNNLASLDQLTTMFPILLLFLVPAITMGAWADERKLGTEELLFTLPASDLEILLGKYFAVLAVYTIALAFSVTHVVVLAWIGNPDWGVIFTTYFGYWLAGAALLSAGMFASVLTNNTTVAFVLGTAICAIPVFIDRLASSAEVQWIGANELVRNLGVTEQLRDFGLGMIPLSGVLYFVSLTLFMLYLNLVFITKRHWSTGQQTNMGLQFVVRTIAAAVILVSLNAAASARTYRADMTSENLYSLSPATREIVSKVNRERPITISAFISPQVPRDYVPVRKQLIGLLRQFDQLGGSAIDVQYTDVEPSSEAAEQARAFGIEPRRVFSERDGRRVEEEVFLGVVVSSANDEVVVPFFGPGTPIEYELTRSVMTASNEKRLTVGVLTTDAQLISGSRQWRIITELKKQYAVVEVSPDSPIDTTKYDVLLAVLPSSLTQPQMANFVDYVKKGRPVLILDDPFPFVFNSMFGVSNAPRQPKPSPGGGGMFGMQQQPGPPKADEGKATSLLNALDIAWDNGQMVWDMYNPHLEFGDLPPEYLFVSSSSGVPTAFSQRSQITRGLQEIFAAFTGVIRPRAGSTLNFEPLLRTSERSGLMEWDEYTEPSFDFQRMSSTARLKGEDDLLPYRRLDGLSHVLAAHITSTTSDRPLNVVYVADIDLISDWFFDQRDLADANLRLDNVTFVLNAVDVLAGENAFLDLRKRRPENRTLLAVEARTAEFKKQRAEQEEAANKKAQEELEAARARFTEDRKKIEEDKTLDDRTREVMLRNIQATEQRKLDVSQVNIERQKASDVDQIKAQTNRRIRATENRIMWAAVLIPPIPAVILGLVVLSMRLTNERRDIASERRVRKN